MEEGCEEMSAEKRRLERERSDLCFGSPQKLVRLNEYPFNDPSMCSDAPSFPWLANPFRTQGQGIAVAPRYPMFTPAQWQELQRQALIYKHLVSSMSIPVHLLLPSAPALYPAVFRDGGFVRLRFPSDSTDPEPGRCRRTDGKKWRCTRDVTPDHKYCERHMHRGRPRSRKPVERPNKTTNTTERNTTSAPVSTVPAQRSLVKFPFLSMLPEKETRYENDSMNSAFRVSSDPNDPCYSFPNQELSPLDQRHQSKRFMDAWSTGALDVCTATATYPISHGLINTDSLCNKSCASSPMKLSPSSLTLSMSGCCEDHEQVQMGLSLIGGPLGEVLRPSNVVSRRGGGVGDHQWWWAHGFNV